MKTHEAITQFIEYRSNLGEKVRTIKYLLLGFGKYVGLNNELDTITQDQCCKYLNLKGIQNGKTTSYWFCIYSAIEGLYKWAIVRGYVNNFVLPKHKPNKPESFIPYIYSNDELKRIFSAAKCYRKRFNILFPEVIQTMLKTTYSLGLRPSETVNLYVNDINIANSLIEIRESKFYKSRIVPMGDQVRCMIMQYLNWRVNMVSKLAFTDNHMFLDRKGSQVKLSALQEAFRRICDKAGVHRNDNARCDVRLQDLRHTFATNRITQWYNEEKDVQKLLPVLSTYLGHCNIDSTSVYITLTDSILSEASVKFKMYVDL
jgi:integrase/recombinase XerD